VDVGRNKQPSGCPNGALNRIREEWPTILPESGLSLPTIPFVQRTRKWLGVTLLYFVAGFLILVASYRRLDDPQHRRHAGALILVQALFAAIETGLAGLEARRQLCSQGRAL